MEYFDILLAKKLSGGGGGGSADAFIAGYAEGTLTEIVVPEGVTTIRESAFRYYPAPVTIDLPSTLDTIGGRALSVSASTTDKITIISRATTPPEAGQIGLNVTYVEAIYVPAGSVDAYKAAANWNTYADLIQAIPE